MGTDRAAQGSGHRWLRELLLPFALTVLAALAAHLTWDGTYFLIPAAWLLAAPIATSFLAGPRPALISAAAGVVIQLFAFIPPRWSFRMHDPSDIRALAAFAAMAVGVTLALEQVERARREADRSLTSLDTLLAHAPIGIGFLDHDLRFVRVNEALAAMNGIPADEHLGRRLSEIITDPQVVAVAERALVTGVPVFDVPFAHRPPTSERTLHVLAGYYPVATPDGTITGLGAVLRDVTASALVEAERAALFERATRLQEITASLSAARTTADVAHVAVHDVRRAVGARAASFCTVEGDEIVVRSSDGHEPEMVTRWQRFSVQAETPFAEAVRRAELVFAGTREEIIARWPGVSTSLSPGPHSLAALPLVVEGAASAAIGLSFDTEGGGDTGDDTFLAAVATQCSQALARAQLYESEREARAASEAAGVRLAFLAESSAVLASSLDWEATLRQVAGLAVPRLADWCAVFLGPERRSPSALEVTHADPAHEELLRNTIERWPIDSNDPVGLGAVLRTGESLLVTDVSQEQLEAAARDHEHLAALERVGFRSVVAVPMHVQDRIIGLIAIATGGDRRLGPDDLALTEELATRAGQAVLNAQLFEERSHTARTLQASLLPPATPTVPGMDVATRFFALGRGIDVGGDFYDVFRIGPPSAPSDRWAVVIGDVRGKGTEAAVVSGAARNAIRSAALHTSSPAAMLAQLNDLLLVMADVDDDEPRFCTAVVAAVERREGGAVIDLAVGGHPTPLVLRSDGTTEAVGQPGTVLGVLPSPELHDTSIELRAGEALVLYTDGVTERHEGDRFFDEEALASVLSRCTGFTAGAVAERVETASRAFLEDAPRDDLAIVVARVPTRTASSSSTSTELPVDETAPQLGRRFVTAVLDGVRDRQIVETARLLTSELVTNAVLHGTAPIRIAVESDEHAFRVSVSDGAPGEPTMGRGDLTESGRGIFLIDRLARRWGVTPGKDGKAVWFELGI